MRPLADLRIIAIEQYGAGPFATLQLADLGAEVIKIEDPRTGGDVGRHVPPYSEGDDSLFFESFNRNKRSVVLDITSSAGREVLLDLVAVSDVVFSNLRGDLPAKLGIRYEDLAEANPRIVCCSLSGFGMTGPRRAQPAYDYLIQGMTGWMSLTGDPEGPPEKTGVSLVDYCGGYVATMAMLAGLHAARRDGRGMDCDVSLYDTALALLTYPATWHLTANFVPTRTRQSAHPSLVPCQNFQTSDGWIVVVCAKDKFWQRLCKVMDRDDLAQDLRFVSAAGRREHRDVLLPELETSFLAQDTGHWLAKLEEAGVPCGPVNSIADALAEDQTLAREMIATIEHPRFGMVREVASPLKVGDEPLSNRRAPLKGEDADDVFGQLLGYSPERVARLATDIPSDST
ncbi:CoA transferase [Geodermatophilus sp. DF01-2]|uniref:CaiB/BaiF CoA transferase family protein n=1 Tax=Geodermatophilus sp. DF01-2 TaxID=2559610 RepID=UPI00107403C3|nr:CoA transferase [Geodermatophilus sp. DF01_2]TFV61899.1 CoA transferase [Geodermatophilus sp. DF01_2]